MRHITHNGLALIKHFEGFRPEIYYCPAGLPTIGYGHVLRETVLSLYKEHISESTAEQLLRSDVQDAERAVLRLIDVSLSDEQFDALVSFTFNLGEAALQRSTLRRKINQGYHHEAAREFKRWVWAGGKRLKGLVRRRQAESDLYSGHAPSA